LVVGRIEERPHLAGRREGRAADEAEGLAAAGQQIGAVAAGEDPVLASSGMDDVVARSGDDGVVAAVPLIWPLSEVSRNRPLSP
jgi:hypothetical protein